MPMVPDIKKEDISIALKYTREYDEARCVEALWSIYNLLKSFKTEGLHCLYSIGVLGEFENGDLSYLSVDYQKKDVKKSAWFSSPKGLFSLEKNGFYIFDLELKDCNKPKNKLTQKDIISFKFSYPGGMGDDNLLLGLKLFALACGSIKGDPFNVGDIRVMYKDAPKMYAPPVEEIFYTLTENEKQAAYKIHEKLESLGCARNLEREHTMRYYHLKAKNKPLATIYPITQFWFFNPEQKNAEEPEGKELAIKLNLRNIGAYASCLSECTSKIQQAIINTADCYSCKKACGGVQFEFNGIKYAKCPWYVFRFNDFTEHAVDNYINLLELESEILCKNNR